jgi:surfeit locus 1 family protein
MARPPVEGNASIIGARFRPGWTVTVASILGIALFMHLGLWQYGKAQTRLERQAEYEARMRDMPVMLAGQAVTEDLRYRKAMATGRYIQEWQVVLDNQTHQGVAGYRILTPLRIEGTDWHVLVDRGWVPAPRDRRALPEFGAPPWPVSIQGVLAPPPPRHLELEAAPAGWQTLWENFDLERHARLSSLRLLPLVLRLDPQEPAGYIRAWPAPGERAEKNLSYAMQWFGMGAALFGFWLYVGFKNGKQA